jgi:autoinducer 2-degrading protein
MNSTPSPASAAVATDLPEIPIVAIFAIDVVPERRSHFLAEMELAMRQSAQEPGVVSFMLLADHTDPNRFTAVDVYRDREAYEAHLKAPQTQKLVDALNGCLLGPPAGTLHHLLATKQSCLGPLDDL